MIDFKAITEKIREQQGYCSVSTKCYATISATRVSCLTGKRTEQDVHWIIDSQCEKPILQILGGVTGYESWYIEDLQECWVERDTFCACAGTPGRWDELWLDPKQVKAIVDQFAVGVKA